MKPTHLYKCVFVSTKQDSKTSEWQCSVVKCIFLSVSVLKSDPQSYLSVLKFKHSSSLSSQIISTAVMTYTKHFDQHGRIKEIQYEIFRSLMYWITIQYDNMGRVTKREIKIGPFANTTKYGYEYDVDGQLQTVSLNEKMMWR